MVINPTLILSALLRPAVRFCIRRGLRIKDIEEVLRKTLVYEAQSAIEGASGEISVSKTSVITGIHRVEVARIVAGEERPKSKHDLLNRVIGLWTQSKEFREPKTGKPRALTHQGLNSEFAKLVQMVSREVSHYPVLFELERIAAVEMLGELIRLKVVEYTPTGDVDHGLDILSDDIEALTSTVENNLVLGKSDPQLHLRTVYDNIDPDNLDSIRRWIIRLGSKFHTEVREYLASLDRDVNPSLPKGAERAKVSVSMFSSGIKIEPLKQVKPKRRGRKKRAAHQGKELNG
jgi:hypothetical protein